MTSSPLEATPPTRRIHIVGRKNSGKTTLVCDLVQELRRRGLNVATIKHTHHHHELDTPGKDSFLHREAGAVAVGILSPQMTAMFFPVDREATPEGARQDRDQRYVRFESLFADTDVILVEGDLQTNAPRIEVWRTAVSERPYAANDDAVAGVITDDSPPDVRCPIVTRRDIGGIADLVLSLLSQR